MFLFGIRPRKKLVAGGMRAANIASVPCVASALVLRRTFQNEHARPGATGGERRTKGSIASSEDDNVVDFHHSSALDQIACIEKWRGQQESIPQSDFRYADGASVSASRILE